MWRWIKLLWDMIWDFFTRYKEIKAEEEVERKEHYEEVQVEVSDEIEKQHQEVVDSADPNATVDQQLRDLDLVK